MKKKSSYDSVLSYNKVFKPTCYYSDNNTKVYSMSNKISANLPKLLNFFAICLILPFLAWNRGCDYQKNF